MAQRVNTNISSGIILRQILKNQTFTVVPYRGVFRVFIQNCRVGTYATKERAIEIWTAHGATYAGEKECA